ncbi:hypothetical protein [Nitrospirillum bahiense]|uniref:Uncharacterized protein n=1 Tax=Nitrospirillum amazonense TaxID=28077 RepID=A0A560F1W3_9PROT|nr:hypothetical protein [Nitrospirillum amazonense]TWB15613.1 hypothetical protein FBZ88_12966 [Nitrospirillum amazonense]
MDRDLDPIIKVLVSADRFMAQPGRFAAELRDRLNALPAVLEPADMPLAEAAREALGAMVDTARATERPQRMDELRDAITAFCARYPKPAATTATRRAPGARPPRGGSGRRTSFVERTQAPDGDGVLDTAVDF